MRRLSKELPDNWSMQYSLSIGYEKVGDVLYRQRKLSEAKPFIEETLKVRTRLVKADPSNAEMAARPFQRIQSKWRLAIC